MQPATTAYDMLCPKGLHRLNNLCICIDRNGLSDPRICQQCQNDHPDTRSHSHNQKSKPMTRMTMSGLIKLNSEIIQQYNQFVESLDNIEQQAERKISRLWLKSALKQKIESQLKALKKQLRINKQEGQLRGRIRRTLDLIDSGEWNGLSCQDIFLFKRFFHEQKQQYYQKLKQKKKQVRLRISSFCQKLDKIVQGQTNFTTSGNQFTDDLFQKLPQFHSFQFPIRTEYNLRRHNNRRAETCNKLARRYSVWNGEVGDRESLRLDLKAIYLAKKISKAQSLLNAGVVSSEQEEFEKAQQYFKQALRLSKNYRPWIQQENFMEASIFVYHNPPQVQNNDGLYDKICNHLRNANRQLGMTKNEIEAEQREYIQAYNNAEKDEEEEEQEEEGQEFIGLEMYSFYEYQSQNDNHDFLFQI